MENKLTEGKFINTQFIKLINRVLSRLMSKYNGDAPSEDWYQILKSLENLQYYNFTEEGEEIYKNLKNNLQKLFKEADWHERLINEFSKQVKEKILNNQNLTKQEALDLVDEISSEVYNYAKGNNISDELYNKAVGESAYAVREIIKQQPDNIKVKFTQEAGPANELDLDFPEVK